MGYYISYLKYITLKTLPLLPTPRYATFSCFAAREFYYWVFLCVLWFPGAEAGSNTWCGRHSPFKNLSVFPPQMLPWTFAGWQPVATWCFCWNVHSGWPCPSVNRIVKADSCVTSPCKQPQPFPFLNCWVGQSCKALLPGQSGVTVHVADESNWKNHWKKKSAWGHLSLNSPGCENSRHLFTSLQGAGLKCLNEDRKVQIFFLRKASIQWETGSYVVLWDLLGAVLLPSEEKKQWVGYNWNWLWFGWIMLMPLSARSTYKVIKVLTAD